MEFKRLKDQLKENFDKITALAEVIFEVEVDKDELYALYLDSFPEGTNERFRERRAHDCSACRQFIKNIGNVVVIKDGVVKSIWDFETGSHIYQPVVDAMDAYIKSKPIVDVYFSPEKRVGQDYNFEEGPKGPIRWNHFHVDLPAKFVNRGASIATNKAKYRDVKNVFKRSLDELSEESINTVLDLIYQNSLYKGEEWRGPLELFKRYYQEYHQLPEEAKDIYAWEQSVKAGPAVGKIRNHSIGVLLQNITDGMDLDAAVTQYERITAPANYKRPKAIFTKKMLEDAKAKVEELGFTAALGRRFANVHDVTANNILFINRDVAKQPVATDVFAEMEKDVAVNPKKFTRVEEISIEDFIKNVLPTATSVEALVEGRHALNFMSLIGPKDPDAKTMFKWDNPFSWAYAGNMTDSAMKERVKAAGGNVSGVLRFSIQWNERERDKNDLDAHCKQPSRKEIYYGDKVDNYTTGSLDVDIIDPTDAPAVENITWTDISKMPKGTYQFFVHCYTNRGGRDGFRAEIEFNGQIYAYDYSKPLKDNERVMVAEVTLHEDNTFTIKEHLNSSMSSRDIWGVKTNQFVPVSMVMYSPNYWNEQDGIGHRHYFFILDGCLNEELPNGFYNEFLKQELAEHKRVFEALGSKMHVDFTDDQLSGVGFSSTKRNDIIVKVKGSFERVLKIKF